MTTTTTTTRAINFTAAKEAAANVQPTTVNKVSLKKLLRNSWDTTKTVLNETVTLTNDVVSLVPATITTAREVGSLTTDFTTTIAKRTVMTEDQVHEYNALTSAERRQVRKQLAVNAALDVADWFKDEEEETSSK